VDNLPAKVVAALRQWDGQVSEAYSGLSALRALVNAIPCIGSPLDALLGTRGQNYASRRLQRTIEELHAQCAALDQAKLDCQFLDSEQFYDLVRGVFEQAQRTADADKVTLYVRILLRRCQAAPYSENAQEYLDLIAGLTPPEIQVATAAYRHAPRFKESDVIGELPGMTEDMVTSYLARLQRTGLVLYVAGPQGTLTDETGDDNTCQVQEYFHRMMQFLELSDLSRSGAAST
jgi:hypothetical protein